jgi:hypothetical protein
MPSIAEKLAGLVSTLSVNWQAVLAKVASLRAPMRGEILAIACTTTQRQYEVPDGTNGQPLWKGRIVNMLADGGDVYLQVSDGLDAAVDETAVAVETLVPTTTRYRLTPSVSGNGCWLIPSGTWIPVAFETTNQTFAVKATATCKLRTHVAES